MHNKKAPFSFFRYFSFQFGIAFWIIAIGASGCGGGDSNSSVGGDSSNSAGVSSTYSISGAVTGSVEQDVTITLSGSSTGTTTTDSNGNYSFTGLADGSYSLTASIDGYFFSPGIQNETVSGADITGIDFVASVAGWWTWVSGNNTVIQPGVYGTMGTPAATNKPGAREKSISWVDGSGNLWLFGGNGIDSTSSNNLLNDLWKFDGTNWTWVSGSNTGLEPGVYGDKGVSASANEPGAREGSISWIDGSGNFWLFGGWGVAGNWIGKLNDLWKFDGTNWTWVSGDDTVNWAGVYGTRGVAEGTNMPGSRNESISWMDDSGNLWLFGGSGFDIDGDNGDLNDLWKFDGTNWTWVSGDSTAGQAGVYGTRGVAEGANKPGARNGGISWIDGSGNLWLFGGNGFDINGDNGDLNDLWKFDGTNWTWVSGDSAAGQAGVYGTRGVAEGANKPGARNGSISWIDGSGNLWLLGGSGFDINGDYGDLNDLWKFDGTNWTWVAGGNTVEQAGVYGTKGVAAEANTPGSLRYSISWVDSGSNLILFGGLGVDGNMDVGLVNDLWKFDGTNWTWVWGDKSVIPAGVYGTKGVAASTNKPGARDRGMSWVDNSDNLWLFGGYGVDVNCATGLLNDLWRFDGAVWTWVSGDDTAYETGVYGTKGVASPTNKPGPRSESLSWIDSGGNLWLFGGLGSDANYDFGYLNDLWKFDGTNWTWVSGSNTVDQAGVYGTKGVASAANNPGARRFSISWTDSSDNLWLFGGEGIDGNGDEGYYLNDLWKFDGTNWTWVSGDEITDQAGVYGIKGVAASANKPGGRYGAISWIDSSGNLWLFGGNGVDSTDTNGDLNDLWKFDGTNWTWVSGDETVIQPGVYGVRGTPSAANKPGARTGSINWIDSSDNLWLFGGQGVVSDDWGLQSAMGQLSDLWKFDGTNWTWVSGDKTLNQMGVYGTKGTAAPANKPGARLWGAGWVDSSDNLWLFGGLGFDINGMNNDMNDLWVYEP